MDVWFSLLICTHLSCGLRVYDGAAALRHFHFTFTAPSFMNAVAKRACPQVLDDPLLKTSGTLQKAWVRIQRCSATSCFSCSLLTGAHSKNTEDWDWLRPMVTVFIALL